MDAVLINPFIESVASIMPQLGFSNVQPGETMILPNKLTDTGVFIIVGIVGDAKGNVAYKMSFESAGKIAATMMMCEPPIELDDMAQSALSELANMLTANTTTLFSAMGINTDITTPTLLQGLNVSIKLNSEKVFCVPCAVDDLIIEIYISLDK